jgi:hypothetical protein
MRFKCVKAIDSVPQLFGGAILRQDLNSVQKHKNPDAPLPIIAVPFAKRDFGAEGAYT